MITYTATLVASDDMQAILGEGRTWLYVAPEKVLEWRGPDGAWYPMKADEADVLGYSRTRTRTVPVVPPAPVTCPACTHKTKYVGCPTCLRCGGSGTVPAPLLLCAEQARHERGGHWYDWHLPTDDEGDEGCTSASESYTTERRTAGLVLVERPTYLPVLDGNDPLLAPGGVLVTWDRADTLDPPIVEMTVEMRFVNDRTDTSTPAGTCHVPLSVGTGFTEVEL